MEQSKNNFLELLLNLLGLMMVVSDEELLTENFPML